MAQPKTTRNKSTDVAIRDRVRELRRVRASELRPHPRNWRQHPRGQRAALAGILSDVGYADALLARELADGSLELIDGHLRAEVTPDAIVPVLVLDVSEAEAAKLLTLLDPLAAMAETDGDALAGLLREVASDDEAVRAVLQQLADDAGASSAAGATASGAREPIVAELWQVVIDCPDEAAQRELFTRLTAEGHKCRVVTL